MIMFWDIKHFKLTKWRAHYVTEWTEQVSLLGACDKATLEETDFGKVEFAGTQ